VAQANINYGTLPNDKTGDSLRTAMIKVQNNFTELYTTAPISNSVNIGNTTSNVAANSTTVFIGNTGTYTIANSTSITATSGYYSQVLNSGANNLVVGTTNATSILLYTNGITSANLRFMIAANGNVGVGNGAPNELLTVGGTMSANQVIIGNTTVNFVVNSTFIPATANYALTSNGTNFVGSVSAANVVSNAQLQANLANYTDTSGLISYVAGATANNTSFVGSVSAANVVSNAQLSSNLANYQTTAGLNANIAAYIPTYGGVVNGSSFTVASSFTANSTVVNAVSYRISSSFIANTTGTYHTGTINAASHTVGSSFIANTTGTYHTGTINAASYTVGSSFVANSIGVTTSGFANITGTTYLGGAVTLGASANLDAGSSSYVLGGFSVVSYNLGTLSSGTTTLNPGNGNYQYYTNNGAHTIAAPTRDCAIDILITNGASAGSITFSGFTADVDNVGDIYATTNTYKFLLMIRRINSISTYVFKALQ
jgi:hypothetical protein